MNDIASLRKSDRSRIIRRAVNSADELKSVSSLQMGPPWAKFLVAGYSGLLLGALLAGSAMVLGWLTGLWPPVKLPVILPLVTAGIVYSSFEVWRRGPSRAAKAQRRRDLDSGFVDELVLGDVVAAKGFRDPEHGSLAYFLKLADGRVFFDYFDGEMAEPGWEKAIPNIPVEKHPKRALHLIYGTASGSLLRTRMSGESFEPESVSLLKGNTRYWPSCGSFRKTAWDDIERQFAAR